MAKQIELRGPCGTRVTVAEDGVCGFRASTSLVRNHTYHMLAYANGKVLRFRASATDPCVWIDGMALDLLSAKEAERGAEAFGLAVERAEQAA